jgi:hypothetical protein
VRLSTELNTVLKRDSTGVLVLLKKRTPVEDGHNPAEGDPENPTWEEHYDEIVLCCLADACKKILGRSATFREKKVLGTAKFSDDITITHSDSKYMEKHYQNFYDPKLAISQLPGRDDSSRTDFGKKNFRPMYYIKMYPEDTSKLEMAFDTTNYQGQFPEKVPFEQHVFQTIYLNKSRDSKLWPIDDLDESKIIRKDWWHQLCHSWTHYAFVVPFMMFVQAKNHTRFASSWTLVNAHEVAIISGLAAAVDLGAEYPEDLEHDKFAFLCFRMYYLLAYGKWYRRRFKDSSSEKAKEGKSWASGLYGSQYQGPGVSKEHRSIWKEEVKVGRSTGNLTEVHKDGRSQP